MLDIRDPQKQQLAKLVRGLFEEMKHGQPSKEPLKAFIEKDWTEQADICFADLGELVIEAVMCGCETVVVTEPGEQHHPDCDMWDSKAG